MKNTLRSLALAAALALSTSVSASSAIAIFVGQETFVGNAVVSNTDGTITIEFQINAPWEMVQSHVAVATSLSGIPQKNGNPIPGQFEYQSEHSPAVTSYTYTLPTAYSVGTPLYIAVHTRMRTLDEASPYAASGTYDFVQGSMQNGGSVLPERSNPDEGLVPGGLFWSFGFGGQMVAEFDCPIVNRDGADLSVREVTNGYYPPESVHVEVSQTGAADSWVSLGSATNGRLLPGSTGPAVTTNDFDLGALAWARYVRLTDTTNPVIFEGTADGFELDGILSLQSCYAYESGWAGWHQNGFGGKNWATYFRYTLQ